ncbi:hypothetical protein [Aminivibrio sp.]|jgi:hypothetical protein|uniref:hypothetical protein n=1 Tax=Aminivibrio sp. TaxID=1872489 RepID=UPI003D95691B
MFTYEFYITLVKELIARGYSTALFKADCCLKAIIYLRHDVDCDPLLAYNMAKIEAEHNLFSTFFFQADGDLYSLLCEETRKVVCMIADMGHTVGLHVSPDSCKNIEDLKRLIHLTVDYLKQWNLPFSNIFSFHRPGSFSGWSDVKLPGFINVYSQEYFRGIHYVSDSNRRKFWETVSFSAIHQDESLKSIQLLTHPVWWNTMETSPAETGSLLLDRSKEQTKRALKKNIKLYRNLYFSHEDLEAKR